MTTLETYREGPYVQIGDGNLIISYLDRHHDKWQCITDTFSRSESPIELAVSNPFMDFTVSLPAELFPVPDPGQSYSMPGKFLAFSDIEGNFYALRSILLSQGVMDDHYNWSFGDGHLMVIGDLVDRGSDVTPCLWLLYKLELQARQNGGMLHILLGNHEHMVFTGDLRYSDTKYLKLATSLGTTYPDLMGRDYVIGNWLRNKPAVVKVGNILFSHAGISPTVAELGLTIGEINSILVEHLNFEVSPRKDELLEILTGSEGIIWYRGWLDSAPRTDYLDDILEQYKVGRMILGHTPVPNIAVLFGGRMIDVDLIQPAGKNRGPARALLYENDHFFQVSDQSDKELIL